MNLKPNQHKRISFNTTTTAVQIIRIFGNGSRISDENLVILEFKYLQNKKW